MGMKFLNKKGWHTGTIKNQERVWKAEQKHEEEAKKLDEIRKQYAEERQVAEFRQLQEQAGLVPRQERLEFLYDSGLATGKGTADDYLLGKPLEEDKADSDFTKLTANTNAVFNPPPSDEPPPPSANEVWRKLHSDPLLQIKQQELAARSAIRNNPVKMLAIRKETDLVKEKRREEKRKRKEERKAERKRKKESKRAVTKDMREGGSDSVSDDSQERGRSGDKREDDRGVGRITNGDREYERAGRRDEVGGRRGGVGEADGFRRVNREGGGDRNGEYERGERDSRGARGEEERYGRGGHREVGGGEEERGRGESRGGRWNGDRRSPLGRDGGRGWKAGGSGVGVGGSRGGEMKEEEMGGQREYSRRGEDRMEGEGGRERGAEVRRGGEERRAGSRRHDSSDSEDLDKQAELRHRHGGADREEGRVGRREREGDRESRKRHDSSDEEEQECTRKVPVGGVVDKHNGVGLKIEEEGGRGQGKHDSSGDEGRQGGDRSSGGEEDTKYGLYLPRGGVVESSRKLLPGGSLLGETRVSKNGTGMPPPPPRVKHEAGKLSEGEKAKRLAEMLADAEVNEDARWQRVKRADEKEKKEEKKDERSGGRNFVEDANKAVYGTGSGGSASIEESVRRMSHFREGGGGGGDVKAFRR